jgi:electron transport complex protein RnfB
MLTSRLVLAVLVFGLLVLSRVRHHALPRPGHHSADEPEPALDLEAQVDRIDRLLPQTQCGQCGYPGCRPYATAIARDEADINQCPPGGAAGIQALAELLGREPKPLNPANGVERPRTLVRIDEATCIGCTKCIQACPVDAIVGAPKRMHTVVAELCTGCDLCLPPCPVDCIEIIPAPLPPAARSMATRSVAG